MIHKSSDEQLFYVVESGETEHSVARLFGVRVDAVRRSNPRVGGLRSGDVLLIPAIADAEYVRWCEAMAGVGSVAQNRRRKLVPKSKLKQPQRKTSPKSILPPGTQTWADDTGPATSPITREEAARVDEILKRLFTKEGSGAVVSGCGFNPSTLKNDPKQLVRGYNDQTFRPHLWSAMHIYPNPTGEPSKKLVELYIPEGIGRGETKLKNAAHGRYDTFYEQLGSLRNVTLITSHVGKFRVDVNNRNAMRSIRVGEVGTGEGGNSGTGFYVHSHLSIKTSDGRFVSFYDAFSK